jgi:hypothetical protein
MFSLAKGKNHSQALHYLKPVAQNYPCNCEIIFSICRDNVSLSPLTISLYISEYPLRDSQQKTIIHFSQPTRQISLKLSG